MLKGADPDQASYVGKKEVGEFMKKKVFEPGRTLTWNGLTKFATGADLNPIGPRLHAELGLLEEIGMAKLAVLHAATTGGRELNGLGAATAPQPGSAADLILLEGNPLDDMAHLRQPKGVVVFGRFVVDPRGGRLSAPMPGPYA